MRIFPQRDNEEPVLIMTDEDTTDCAWCRQAQGLPMGNGSHGICAFHAAQVRQQQAERRAARNVSQRSSSDGIQHPYWQW